MSFLVRDGRGCVDFAVTRGWNPVHLLRTDGRVHGEVVAARCQSGVEKVAKMTVVYKTKLARLVILECSGSHALKIPVEDEMKTCMYSQN